MIINASSPAGTLVSSSCVVKAEIGRMRLDLSEICVLDPGKPFSFSCIAMATLMGIDKSQQLPGASGGWMQVFLPA